MPTMQELGVFFVIVLGTVALPGLDMAYILARSLAGGARDSLLAVLGVVLGVMVHVVVGVLGVAAILLVAPWAFNLLLCAGAAYLAWIGWTLVRHASAAGHFRVAEARKQSPARIVSMGVATSLSNPKAYLFMLAVFPQFIDPARGSLWAQAGVLLAHCLGLPVGRLRQPGIGRGQGAALAGGVSRGCGMDVSHRGLGVDRLRVHYSDRRPARLDLKEPGAQALVSRLRHRLNR